MLIGCWQIEVLNTYLFLTAKPVIYLVNLSAKDYSRKKNKWFVAAAVCCATVVTRHRLAKIKEWIDAREPKATIIPFSAEFELKVSASCLCYVWG